MTTKDYFEIVFGFANIGILCVTAYFIYRSIFSPVDAVKTGRKLNNEQQKDNAKRNLFLTLFALRGSPVNYDFVRALNQIDIVFEDTPSVLDAWHTHYDSLQIKGQANENQIWDLQRTNLLSAMAVSLGYNRIRQTDMLKNYYPEGHSNQFREDWELRFAAKQFLTKGNELCEILIANANANQQDQDETKTQS
jgi:hypothetical protein